jgi:alpha-beta hydrolase superfamily lysophospholipase
MVRFVVSTVVVCVLAALLAVAVLWFYIRPATPDAFYDFVLDPTLPRGTLLKQEIFTRNLPQGTKGWRILYQTTRQSGAPAVASAVVVVSVNTRKPSPVIAWAHGTTGVARGCAPSLFENPFPNIPAFPAMVEEGWAYVATDYVGQGTTGGHAYLIGNDAARNVLDSLRATRQMTDVTFDARTLIWGHSQGGNTALWTGQLAPAYAPELDIRGVAAIAPASDLEGLMRQGQALPFGKILSAYIINSYTATYPDLRADDLASPWSRIIASDISSRCIGGWDSLFSVIETKLLAADGVFRAAALDGPFAVRLRQNSPTGPISAPLFIGQGVNDDLVFPAVQDAYVKFRCAAGQQLDYRRYNGLDHLSIVAPDGALSSDLLEWSRERLAGTAFQAQCAP